MNQVSNIIAEARKSTGLNKSQAAAKLGISSQLLGQYESGKKMPKAEFYKKWKEVFGRDILYNEPKVSTKDIVYTRPLKPDIWLSEHEERIIKIEASLTVMLVTLAELTAKSQNKPIAKVAVELSKTIDSEADRIFDELLKKRGV